MFFLFLDPDLRCLGARRIGGNVEKGRLRAGLRVFDVGCKDEARGCLRADLSGREESVEDLGIGVVIVLDGSPEVGS